MIERRTIKTLVINSANRYVIMMSVVLGMVSISGTVLETVSTYYFGELIDAVRNSNFEQHNLISLILCWLGAGFLPILYQYIDAFVSPNISKLTSNEILSNRFKSYPWPTDLRPAKLAEYLSTVANNVSSIHNITFYDFVRITTLVTISVFLLSNVHSAFPIILICWAFIYLGISFKLTKRVALSSSIVTSRRANKQNRVTDVFSNIREIFVRSVISQELEGLYQVTEKERQAKSSHRLFLAYLSIFQTTFRIGFIAYITVTAYLELKAGEIGIADFAMSLQLSILFAMQIQEFSNRMYRWSGEIGSLSLALKELSYGKITDYRKNPRLSISRGSSVIEFIDVNLRIEERFLLKNFNLKINPGDKVLIRGPSGIGKSTIFRLLLKEVVPDLGQILINGQNISEFSNKQLSRLISVVFQNSSALDRTLRANITFNEKEIEEKQIDELLTKFELNGVVQELSEGLDTEIVSTARSFSGGEMQRILLMRGLLKSEYQILLLDEVTSALDGKLADKLIRYILCEYTDKTILVISHTNIKNSLFNKVIDLPFT